MATALDRRGGRNVLRTTVTYGRVDFKEPEADLLTARVTEVTGKAQRRKSPEGPWLDLAVGDQVFEGDWVRTAFRSRVVLQVGTNATMMIDGLTQVQIPSMLQVSGRVRLRSRITLPHGRVDFKVNGVGPTNDFEVLTPTTTIAVRG